MRRVRMVRDSGVQADDGTASGTPAGPVNGLGESDDTVAGDVHGSGEVTQRKVFEYTDRIEFVHQLQPGIPAEDHRDERGEPEIPGQRGHHGRADDVREAWHGDPHIRSPSAETPDIGLDVDGITTWPG